jgi:hypothetical protein
MAFVALLLSDVYELEEHTGRENCAVRPIPRHGYFITDAFVYAADMNVLLSYYKELDDWHDDRDYAALRRSEKLKRHIPAITMRWQRQAIRVADCLSQLSQMEMDNVLNPDKPANCFGALMGEILDWRGDSASLRLMGEALGRFIYILDACNDLRDDIRKERYNPLVSQTDTDFIPLLTMLIGECTNEFEKLAQEKELEKGKELGKGKEFEKGKESGKEKGLGKDLHLLRNVLYSGVWMRSKRKSRKGTGDDGSL